MRILGGRPRRSFGEVLSRGFFASFVCRSRFLIFTESRGISRQIIRKVSDKCRVIKRKSRSYPCLPEISNSPFPRKVGLHLPVSPKILRGVYGDEWQSEGSLSRMYEATG